MTTSHPEDPSVFQYQRLKDAKSSIRLIKLIGLETIGNTTFIKCSLKHFQHSTAPKYNALSYEWRGSYPTSDRSILVNGNVKAITSNLYDYLLRMVTSGSLYDHRLRQAWLWVDQLCIDHTNVPEKSAQTALVGDIYRSANMVIVWLGAKSARDCQREAIRHDGHDTSLCKGDIYMHCACSSYWSRLWIIQENVLARDVYVLLDSDLHPWWMVTNRLSQEVASRGAVSEHIAYILRLDKLRQKFPNAGLRWSGVIHLLPGSQCSDVRDKAYGVMGMINQKFVLTPDYSLSSDAILQQVMEEERKAMTAHGTLSISDCGFDDPSFSMFVKKLHEGFGCSDLDTQTRKI